MTALAALLLCAAPAPSLAQAGASDNAHSSWVTLGTHAGPLPSAVRSQPANLLVHGGKYYLVDAGDGVSGQLARDADVGAVVITHFEGYDSDDPRHLEYHGTVSALYRGPVIIANDMDEF